MRAWRERDVAFVERALWKGSGGLVAHRKVQARRKSPLTLAFPISPSVLSEHSASSRGEANLRGRPKWPHTWRVAAENRAWDRAAVCAWKFSPP